MYDDKKLFKWFGLLMVLPLIMAVSGGDRYRYPCQNPANWHTEQCVKPKCEIHRQCPEHIFDDNSGIMDIINRQPASKGAVTK